MLHRWPNWRRWILVGILLFWWFTGSGFFKGISLEQKPAYTLKRLKEVVQVKNELKESQEKLAKAHSERMESNILRDYTERLLSTHPLYASILILLNLGGVLDLPTLAMSVGAHPLKLKQMLGELVTKGLITLSADDPPMVTAVMAQM